MTINFRRFIFLVSGPTGVGKTDFVRKMAQKLPLAIINADVGQLYTPLTLGTAKPDWRNESVPHYLFDVLDEPISLTVVAYRKLVIPLIEDCWRKHQIPTLVGGSLFYLKSLLFPPLENEVSLQKNDSIVFPDNNLWEQLNTIDPERAAMIHPHDSYRLQRALNIQYTTGVKPSLQQPVYKPMAPYIFLYCTRERQELYARINDRVITMLNAGWIDEVRNLLGTPWQNFLLQKKLIGYDSIIHYLLNNNNSPEGYTQLAATIAQKTRHYAKRQEIFWRGLQKKLENYGVSESSQLPTMRVANLTLLDHDLYINQLSDFINNLSKES